MYDLEKDQALELVEDLLSQVEGPIDYTNFDQDLLTRLNQECGNYDLDLLTGGEILMWLQGIRDGLHFYW